MLMTRQSKIALFFFLLVFSNVAIANNCRITQNNIYASNLVDTNCKKLILPNIKAEKGSEIYFACSIASTKPSYTTDHDSIIITGDVTVTNSNIQHSNYRFKTDVYFDVSKSFRIHTSANIRATIANLKFIFKDNKPKQIRIACEYNL